MGTVLAKKDRKISMGQLGIYEKPGDPRGIQRINADGYENSMYHNQPILEMFSNITPFFMHNAYEVNTTNVWDQAASGSGTALTCQAGRGAFAKFVNGASDNNYYAYESKYAQFALEAGKLTLITSHIKVKTAATMDLYFGLCAKILSGNVFDNRLNGIGFFVDMATDAGLLKMETVKTGSAATQEDTQNTMADLTSVKLGILAVGTSNVNFYVNDLKVGDISATIPTVDLAVSFGLRNGEGAANEMYISTINVGMEW